MMDGLEACISSTSIDLNSECRLDALHYGKDDSCCCFTTRRELREDYMVSDQFSDFNLHTDNGQLSKPACSIHNNLNAILKVHGSLGQLSTFIEVRNSPVLLVAGDVGSFCLDVVTAPGILVACCLLTRRVYKGKVTSSEILKELVVLGLVCEGASVLASKTERYEADYVADGDLDDVDASLGPRTSVLHTHNLSRCIDRNLDRWIEVLDLAQQAA